MSNPTNDIAQLGAQLQQVKMKLTEIERVNDIDVVNLTSAQPVLIGKYRASASTIIITLDATNGAFSVELPSAKEVQNKTLTFKKIDAVATEVTLTAKNGEYIHDSAPVQTYGITDTEPVIMVSNRLFTWLVV
jgi:hypothetical protein